MSHEVDRPDDGRVARRMENRTRIVDALFALIQSGRFHPTLKEIAAKAGVTSRTLLNHFPDAASLRQAAVDRGREIAERSLPALPTEGSPESRIEVFMLKAAPFFDRYSAVRWSSVTSRDEIEASPKSGGQVLRRIEGRAAALLEGFGLDLSVDTELFQAMRVVIDPLSWRVLRVHHGLSRQAAAATVARGLVALARDGVARAQSTVPTGVARTQSPGPIDIARAQSPGPTHNEPQGAAQRSVGGPDEAATEDEPATETEEMVEAPLNR